MYDYYLVGSHSFAVDRRMAEQAIAMWPDLPRIAFANRAFLRRSVCFLTEQGIDQFLDIGSGLPTVGNVHEIAIRANSSARVVYVDIDPVAVAVSQNMLRGQSNVAAIEGDLREPVQILRHPQVRQVLDFTRPVGVLLVGVLHFVREDDVAWQSVRTLCEAVAPGSYLAMTHASNETRPELAREHEQLYARTPNPLKTRSLAEITRLLEDFQLVEPGLVFMPLWRPDGPDDLFLDDPERSSGFAAVGRKP